MLISIWIRWVSKYDTSLSGGNIWYTQFWLWLALQFLCSASLSLCVKSKDHISSIIYVLLAKFQKTLLLNFSLLMLTTFLHFWCTHWKRVYLRYAVEKTENYFGRKSLGALNQLWRHETFREQSIQWVIDYLNSISRTDSCLYDALCTIRKFYDEFFHLKVLIFIIGISVLLSVVDKYWYKMSASIFHNRVSQYYRFF